MPWETLQLDPATATVRDVKKAYAGLLKTCRPDQDPEGFRKLHDAYTLALLEIEARDHEPMTSVPAEPRPEPGPPILETYANPVVSPIAGCLDRLTEALERGSDELATLLREAEALVREHPGEILTWGDRMFDLIRTHPDHPDLRLKPEAILFELQHQGLAATLAVIERADRQGNPRAISGLTGLFLDHAQRIATPAGGLAAARLACAAAFWSPQNLEAISDLAYSTLARGERDHHMAMIDQHESMRHFLHPVPDDLKSFFRQRLLQPEDSHAWYGPKGNQALVWLTRIRRRAPEFHDTFVRLLPPELASGHRPVHRIYEPPEPVDDPELATNSSTANTGEGSSEPPLRWQPAQSKQAPTRKGGPRDPFETDFDELPPPSQSSPKPAKPASPARQPAAAPVATAKSTRPPRQQTGASGHGNWLEDEIQPSAAARSRAGGSEIPGEPQPQQRIKTIVIAVIAAVIIIRVLVAIVQMAF